MEKILIVGGGISGLVSSIVSKTDQNEVIIIEKNKICGKKILSTGNGKCNYTNEDQNINHYHSDDEEILKKIITNQNLMKLHNFMKSIGIIPRIKNGYYYPYSNQAVTIQTTLIESAMKKNIDIHNEEIVENIKKEQNHYYVETTKQTYIVDKIILATGSKAYPKLGSDGSGYKLCSKLDHTIIKPLPALVSLKTKEKTKEISGVRVDGKVKLYSENQLIKNEQGEIQFTDYGLSGIPIMQCSRFVSKLLSQNKKVKIEINYIPMICQTKKECMIFLEKQALINQNITFILDSILNYKITNFILKKNKIKVILWKDLTIDEKEKICEDMIQMKWEIIDTNSFDLAQVCSGGVSLKEIEPTTMKSTINNNLFIIGELLDVDGDCGGYNITFAIISGIIAGENIND